VTPASCPGDIQQAADETPQHTFGVEVSHRSPEVSPRNRFSKPFSKRHWSYAFSCAKVPGRRIGVNAVISTPLGTRRAELLPACYSRVPGGRTPRIARERAPPALLDIPQAAGTSMFPGADPAGGLPIAHQ
jgi:hypothetical protein